MRYTFPTDYETAPCYLVPINGSLIPLVAGALKHFEERRSWHDDAEYEQAYNAFAALEAQMTACTMQALVDSNDRLYRLLDSAFNGRIYTVESSDPIVITPAIADVPAPLDPAAGMVAMLDQLPGVLDAGWFGYGGHKATIADIVRSLRVGNASASADIVGQLEGILGAAGNIAQIGELVVETFTSGVSAVEEGGIMVLLAASIVGNLAATGALSSQITSLTIQLSRIIQTLDGGTLLPPSDNILQAIRGDESASDTRNVIDSIVAGLEALAADNPDILAKLEEIRLLLA